jgi:hypothetical protein
MGNKNSVLKRETHKRTDASSTIPPDNPLGIILKGFFLRVHANICMCVCVCVCVNLFKTLSKV